MPLRVGTVIHALPDRHAAMTKCGLLTAAGEYTKARVTCPECKRIGSDDFARGWDDAIARGVTGEDEDAE